MILGEDYKFRDDIKADTVPIELLTGPYKGVTLRYTTVAIQEQVDNTAKLKFDYEFFETGDYTMVGLRKDKVFEQHIGLILNAMILETLEAPQDEPRDDDFEELDNE